VRPHVAGAVKLLVVPTLVLVAITAFVPGRASIAVRLYALFVCGVLLLLLLGALRRSFPAEQALVVERPAQRERRQPPPSLARIEHEAALGVAGSFDLHYRLVPRLRSIASGLLEFRRRISFERDPDLAREILGEQTWSLVRPDRIAPDDRHARGVEPDDLTRVTTALEAI
jgi:hypothetical protein